MESTNTQNGNTQGDTGTLDHKAGCATIFQLGKFDRTCGRCAKVEKVIFLRRKTIENGCTPDEMASAQKLAQTLCDRFLLVDAEVTDRAYAPDVKKAEEAAKRQAAEERAKRQAEAAMRAKEAAEAAAREKAAKEAATAKLNDLRYAMEQAERDFQWKAAEYRNACKDAGVSRETKGTRKSTGTQSTCSGDPVSCPCRSHAAKRAWNTMRQNGNGYAFGNKV